MSNDLFVNFAFHSKRMRSKSAFQMKNPDYMLKKMLGYSKQEKSSNYMKIGKKLKQQDISITEKHNQKFFIQSTKIILNEPQKPKETELTKSGFSKIDYDLTKQLNSKKYKYQANSTTYQYALHQANSQMFLYDSGEQSPLYPFLSNIEELLDLDESMKEQLQNTQKKISELSCSQTVVVSNTQLNRFKYQLYIGSLSKNIWIRKSINSYIAQSKIKGKYPKQTIKQNLSDDEYQIKKPQQLQNYRGYKISNTAKQSPKKCFKPINFQKDQGRESKNNGQDLRPSSNMKKSLSSKLNGIEYLKANMINNNEKIIEMKKFKDNQKSKENSKFSRNSDFLSSNKLQDEMMLDQSEFDRQQFVSQLRCMQPKFPLRIIKKLNFRVFSKEQSQESNQQQGRALQYNLLQLNYMPNLIYPKLDPIQPHLTMNNSNTHYLKMDSQDQGYCWKLLNQTDQ